MEPKDIINSVLCDHKVAENLQNLNKSHYQRYVEKVVMDKVPEGAVLSSDGICRIGSYELKPRACCSRCGIEQRFSDISALVAQNTYNRKCWDCGQANQYQLVSFLAPVDKLRRRIEDQLRKNAMGKLIEIAKLLSVPIGN